MIPLGAKGTCNNLTAFSISSFGHRSGSWDLGEVTRWLQRMSKTAWLDNFSRFCFCKGDICKWEFYSFNTSRKLLNKHTTKNSGCGITVNPHWSLHTCIQTSLDLTAKGDVKILDEQCWTYGLQSIIWTAHQATQQTTHLFLLRVLVQFVHKSDSLSMFSHPSLGLPIAENNAFHW